MMRLIFKLIFFLVALVPLICTPAFGLTLNQAKQQGYIGEKTNGYIGIVTSTAPAEAKKIVADTNSKRKAYYQSIAKNNGISVTEVENLAGQKIVNHTSSGQYTQKASGQWERK